jgi:hypothetical protein
VVPPRSVASAGASGTFAAVNCRICGGQDGRRLVAREAMFGLGEQFPYFECGGCGCLQIEELPQDSARYYRPGYYSLGGAPLRSPSLRRRLVDRWAYDRSGTLLAAFLYWRHPNRELRLLLLPRSADEVLQPAFAQTA